MRQGGFPKARRAIEKDVVQGLAPPSGRLNDNLEVLLDPVLADEVGQLPGTQGHVQSNLFLF